MSRQNLAAMKVSPVRAAAQAHSTRMPLSQTSPPVLRPDRRLPPVMLLPGQSPAHDERCPAVGLPGHVGADLGHDDFGGPLPDPGDRHEQVTGCDEKGR